MKFQWTLFSKVVYQYYTLHPTELLLVRNKKYWFVCAAWTNVFVNWFIFIWFEHQNKFHRDNSHFYSIKMHWLLQHSNESVKKELLYTHTYEESTVRSATIMRMSKFQMSIDRRFAAIFGHSTHSNAYTIDKTVHIVTNWKNKHLTSTSITISHFTYGTKNISFHT